MTINKASDISALLTASQNTTLRMLVHTRRDFIMKMYNRHDDSAERTRLLAELRDLAVTLGLDPNVYSL